MTPEVISAWIAAAVAVIAAVFQLVVNNKKQAIEAVTVNHLEWINNVRAILNDFISEYVKRDDANKTKLLELACRFQLFTRKTNSDYSKLTSLLTECSKSENEFCEAQLEELITCSQEVLNSVWTRVKIESEILFFRSEKRIIRKLNKRIKRQNKHIQET